ncbi:transcription factor SPT20 homolog isoform X2 [Aethina tumida]|uniref:transcription factor SPT20 homolog isoform X2 n=1 Tax=Aethina tumida TaxID=116153 RepID=UPI0021484981|nr:transcription factor SPT20 homolog isoform X2 [Aethina tumida]
MQSLEAACDEGERTIKKLKTNRSSLPLLQTQEEPEVSETSEETEETDETEKNETNQKSIFTKLYELYSELEEQSEGSRIKDSSNLLDKLVARERLNTLILNLYPGNKGYSLAVRASPRTADAPDDTANIIESAQWPYEKDELLMYINNEELPPFLAKDLETECSYLFYNGCIIAEVRDYRQAYPHFKCDIHHVLLRPTLRSLLADINNIVDETGDWGNEDRDQLESQLLLANSPNLCLEPNSLISYKVNQINRTRQMWNTHRFRRAARKFSQVTVNRKRKLDQFTHRHGLELFDFLTRTRARAPRTPSTSGATTSGASSSQTLSSAASTSTSRRTPRHEDLIRPVPVPNLDLPPIAAPSGGVVINEFKAYPRIKETDDCLPQPVEEYTLETDMPSKENGKPRVYHIKLSILQRPSNSEFLGELYLDRDHRRNERNGVACRFSLGSRNNANRYIHQFTDIFTESGRKSVRIRCTRGPYKELAQQQMQAQTNLVQQQLNQIGQNVQGQSPIVNGGISLVQQNQQTTHNINVPILQNQLQGGTTPAKVTQQVSNQELEISALAQKLMNSAKQFQAAANAKHQQQQQQQQKLTSGSSNAAIINLLNSSTTGGAGSEATSAAVASAIGAQPQQQTATVTTTSLLPQQLQAVNQKLMAAAARKMTIPSARVLNHAGNLIAINNNSRLNLADLNSQITGRQQPQTITLTSVNSGGTFTNYTTVPVKQVLNQRIVTSNTAAASASGGAGDNKSLSALLVGTPAADHPDIASPNTNSLLIEKLAGASGNTSSFQGTTHYIQSPKGGQQFMVQSPKGQQTVLTPLSSPPPQNSNTINVQSLNFAQLPLQVQLPGFAQSISTTGTTSGAAATNLQGATAGPTSLLVSMPGAVTTAAASSNTVAQGGGAQTMNSLVGSPTVVLANAASPNLALLVTTGVKGLGQQGIRAAGTAQTVTLSPDTVQVPGSPALSSQLQKQMHMQQYQQMCLSQQANMSKLRRRPNGSEPQ